MQIMFRFFFLLRQRGVSRVIGGVLCGYIPCNTRHVAQLLGRDLLLGLSDEELVEG